MLLSVYMYHQSFQLLCKLRCTKHFQLIGSCSKALYCLFVSTESKELLMSKIQEIVKKVASLPADTFAVPVGSEGSACSSWILKEMDGYNSSLLL